MGVVGVATMRCRRLKFLRFVRVTTRPMKEDASDDEQRSFQTHDGRYYTPSRLFRSADIYETPSLWGSWAT